MKIHSNRAFTIEAPCKINLHLRILGKRPDGFHDLESIFASLALSDLLKFELDDRAGDCKLSLKWEIHEEIPERIPMEENLVFRALSLFREKTGFNSGLRIELVKRVPVKAGLGGGSSDAASTLMALNSLAKTHLSTEKLAEMALQLGSDVPFFLFGAAAFVSGRGEKIEPLALPDKGYLVLLVKPPFSSSTASAFRLLDQFRESERKGFSDELRHLSLEGDPATWPFYNDFLPAFLAKDSDNGPLYKHILETLKSSGASFIGLSGAGSTCFGIYHDEKTAKMAEKSLVGKGNFVRLTFFLANKLNPVVEY